MIKGLTLLLKNVIIALISYAHERGVLAIKKTLPYERA